MHITVKIITFLGKRELLFKKKVGFGGWGGDDWSDARCKF